MRLEKVQHKDNQRAHVRAECTVHWTSHLRAFHVLPRNQRAALRRRVEDIETVESILNDTVFSIPISHISFSS